MQGVGPSAPVKADGRTTGTPPPPAQDSPPGPPPPSAPPPQAPPPGLEPRACRRPAHGPHLRVESRAARRLPGLSAAAARRSGSAPCPPRAPCRLPPPACPASRPLSPPHNPRSPSWVRPEAPQPNNAPPHRPSPCCTSKQHVLLLAERGRERWGGAWVGGVTPSGHRFSGDGLRGPRPPPADEAGSKVWGRPVAAPHASSLKQAGPSWQRRPLTQSRSVTHSLLLVRLVEVSCGPDSCDAQESLPKGSLQALLSLRLGASPCPPRPLLQRTDPAPCPLCPALCWSASRSPCQGAWDHGQSLGPGWQPGGARTAGPVHPDKAPSTRPLPDAWSLAC